MRVLHVIPSISPIMGGPPQVALNLVYALRECGVDAEIVTTNHNGDSLLEVPLDQRVDYTVDPSSHRSVPIWFLPFLRPSLGEFIFSPALTGWMWRHIQEYDILDNHYLFSYAPTCAAAIARLKKVPYTIRTMGQLTPWALAQSRLKKQIYTTLIERQNLINAAAVHCTSTAEIDDVRNFGIQSPTITMPLGVNAPVHYPDAKLHIRQRYGIPLEMPVVLFLSRLHYKKRPELLLQALAQLMTQYRFHAILAGSGEADYIDSLKALAASLGIIDRVSFPGFVMGQEKDCLFQGADLFVLPSFSENFGIAVAEALIAGLPVVITPDIQIASEIAAAKAGLLVQGEVDAVKTAIAQLLDSSALRQQLGTNGIRLAKERYSWKAIAQALIPVYAAAASPEGLRHDVMFTSPVAIGLRN